MSILSLDISPRKNKTLVFLLIAISISWLITYLTNTTFGVFMLTEVLVSGALVYSNEAYLKYPLQKTVLLTVSLLAIFLLLTEILDWVLFIGSSFTDSVYCYALVTLLLFLTQKQVKVGPLQLLLAATLIGIHFRFIKDNPALHFNQEYYAEYTSFFVGQLFTSIYAVSLLVSEKEESVDASLEKLEVSVAPLHPKKPFKFLKFILLALLGVAAFYLIFVIALVGMWGGFTHPKDELVKDFESNTGVFYNVRDYVNRLDPEHKISELEFNIYPEYKTFYITINGQDATKGYRDLQSWVPSDSLLKATPWKKESFVALQEKLNQINCDYIKTGDPFVIGHKPINGQGLFYNLFNHTADHFPYNDTCRFVRYSDTLILEFKHISQYDSDCFPN